ncbi:hypothetical protein TUM19329_00180 [Legionella antarctica]|uniref:Toprim domain-containing protein n=1 Tax=Legionella antarctica TaxID=2708020 RepID=A0A6F8T0G0_9GAMM|nr:toprim domain-containing protein [Legionella antarctica]BCA93657.1 hypothetical protein TUM19329_00180 [Legionella antarctica]
MTVIKLNQNNAGKDEKSDPIKQSFGRKEGYYVELNKAYQKEKTYVTEGVETGLSIVSVDNKARVVTVLGKGNFKNIKHHNLGKEVVLCVDNDGKDTYKTSLIIDALDTAVPATSFSPPIGNRIFPIYSSWAATSNSQII